MLHVLFLLLRTLGPAGINSSLKTQLTLQLSENFSLNASLSWLNDRPKYSYDNLVNINL